MPRESFGRNPPASRDCESELRERETPAAAIPMGRRPEVSGSRRSPHETVQARPPSRHPPCIPPKIGTFLESRRGGFYHRIPPTGNRLEKASISGPLHALPVRIRGRYVV